MRALTVLIAGLCLLLATATAAVAAPSSVEVAKNAFVETPAVDGSSVYYLQRAEDNAGYPISLHRFDTKTGESQTIRTFTDHAVTVSDLRAGGGRVAFVESRVNRSAQTWRLRAVSTNRNGADATELYKKTFKMGTYGDPVGRVVVEKVRTTGEVILRLLTPDKAATVTLFGIARDGAKHKYLSYRGSEALKFAYSDQRFVWWTQKRVISNGFDAHDSTTLRLTTQLVYDVAVDDAGRVLLSTFLRQAKFRSGLRIYRSPGFKNPKVLLSTNRRTPTGQFCGSRMLADTTSPSGASNKIVELSSEGELLSTLYSAPATKASATVTGLTCDASTAAWRSLVNTGNNRLIPYVLTAYSF